MMMSKKFRDEWCAALRSGTYRQGQRCLCKGDKACCLGVALFVEGACTTRPGIDGCTYFDNEHIFPTLSMLKRLGLPNSQASTLADMNDGGETFATIADWIEANVPCEAP